MFIDCFLIATLATTSNYEHRCNAFDSDFVPLAFETYGGTSERFEKLIERISSKAAEFNNIPYPILLNYWKKRISIFPILSCLTIGRKESQLPYKLAMYPSYLKLIGAYSTLEQKQ